MATPELEKPPLWAFAEHKNTCFSVWAIEGAGSDHAQAHCMQHIWIHMDSYLYRYSHTEVFWWCLRHCFKVFKFQCVQVSAVSRVQWHTAGVSWSSYGSESRSSLAPRIGDATAPVGEGTGIDGVLSLYLKENAKKIEDTRPRFWLYTISLLQECSRVLRKNRQTSTKSEQKLCHYTLEPLRIRTFWWRWFDFIRYALHSFYPNCCNQLNIVTMYTPYYDVYFWRQTAAFMMDLAHGSGCSSANLWGSGGLTDTCLFGPDESTTAHRMDKVCHTNWMVNDTVLCMALMALSKVNDKCRSYYAWTVGMAFLLQYDGYYATDVCIAWLWHLGVTKVHVTSLWRCNHVICLWLPLWKLSQTGPKCFCNWKHSGATCLFSSHQGMIYMLPIDPGLCWDPKCQVYGRVNASYGHMQPGTGSGIWGYNLNEKAGKCGSFSICSAEKIGDVVQPCANSIEKIWGCGNCWQAVVTWDSIP